MELLQSGPLRIESFNPEVGYYYIQKPFCKYCNHECFWLDYGYQCPECHASRSKEDIYYKGVRTKNDLPYGIFDFHMAVVKSS